MNLQKNKCLKLVSLLLLGFLIVYFDNGSISKVSAKRAEELNQEQKKEIIQPLAANKSENISGEQQDSIYNDKWIELYQQHEETAEANRPATKPNEDSNNKAKNQASPEVNVNNINQDSIYKEAYNKWIGKSAPFEYLSINSIQLINNTIKLRGVYDSGNRTQVNAIRLAIDGKFSSNSVLWMTDVFLTPYKVFDFSINVEKGHVYSIFSDLTSNIGYTNIIDIYGGKSNLGVGQPVTVKYRDPEGHIIADDMTITGDIGTPFDATTGQYKKDIPNYTFKNVYQGTGKGMISDSPQEVVLVYDKADAKPAVAHFRDTSGNEIAPDETKTGKIGENYEFSSKEIAGYTLKETKGSAKGTFSDKVQEVTFVYDKTEGKPVTAHFQDTNGKVLAPDEIKHGKIGENFEFSSKEIAGYTLKETKGDAKGTFSDKEQEVTFVYDTVKVGTVTIHYVDVHGEPIPTISDEIMSGPVGSKYTLDDILKHKKDIAGYTYKWVNDFEDPGSFGVFKEEGDDVSITYRKDQIPTLKILNVPSVDFGTQEVSAEPGKLIPRSSTEKKDNTFTIMDTLGAKSGDWSLVVSLQDEMHDSKNGRKIKGSPLVYVTDISDPEFGQQPIGIGANGAVSVSGGEASDPDADGEDLNQSYTWSEEEGIFFESRNGMLIGNYEGTLDWTLSNAP